MRACVLFSGILLLFLLAALPVMAAEETSVPTHTTVPSVIPDVTHKAEIIVEPTKEPAAEPTKPRTTEPTRATAEPTKEPTLSPTKETTPALTMAPVEPRTGWVSVISTPSGATVTIDGAMEGVTPLNARELSSGVDHIIRITLSGYEPHETSLRLTAGEHTSVDATLKIIPTPEPTKTPATITTTQVPLGSGKGWIRVNCNVDGATVSFDELSSGCTVNGGSCSTEVAITGSPFKTFTVQKPGYQPYTGQITSWPKNGETVDFYATLNPTQTYGAIEVYTNPGGAVVTLDGGNQKYSPASYSSVLAGTTHTIQVSASNYQPYSTSVWVESGKSTTVNAQLVPVYPSPSSGSISVTTSPSGADIYVDGYYMADSPAVIPGLSPGSHTVRIQKAGYDEYIATVRIIAGQRTPVSVTLATLPPSVGSIEVSSTPPGASVYLDGKYMGQTQTNNYFDLTSLLPGTHTVTLRQPDFQDYTQTVFVTGGKIITINAQMTPVVPGPVADTTGQIVLVSTPPGANVFLDNVFRGITPVTLSDIPQGSHVLTLKLPGYNDAVQTVSVTGGQTTPVSMSLAESAAVPTKESPLDPGIIIGALAVAGICCARWRK
jgi:hypothetical protein